METQRQTAYKLWISNLNNGTYGKGQGEFDPGYVEVNGKQVSRVNILAGVIDKFNGDGYSFVTIDDSSGAVKAKVWKEGVELLKGVEIGDLVVLIGKVRQYNNEIYLSPEIVRKVDNPLWLKVRKQELKNQHGEPQNSITKEQTKKPQVESELNIEYDTVREEKIETTELELRAKISTLIEALDVGIGADIDDLIKSIGYGEKTKELINQLIKDGEIFEVSKGKLRSMA